VKHVELRRYFRHGTLTQLAVFDAVARHANFTRAAEELHLAQPTVSIQMKKLAASLGLTLFEQRGRRVHLTQAGRELQSAVQEVFCNLSDLEGRLRPLRQTKPSALIQDFRERAV
jgi:DNA-binding transcriptional LysR family regulator